MGRLLATFATLLILLLGASLALPHFVDWNAYRPRIEKTASALLGHKVSILGGIDIALLPEPHFRASTIAAGNGKADGALMIADAVDIALSLPALLSGRLEASKLTLVHPALALDLTKLFPGPEQTVTPEAPRFATEFKTIQIEGGRISIYSKSSGQTEALALTQISGTLSGTAPGNPYRFNGHLLQNGRSYEVKLSAAPARARAVKLAGSALDTASKTSIQADGLLNATGDLGFEGSLALTLPRGTGGLNHEIQLKSEAKIGLADATLDDLALTIDPQERPQVLTGSAKAAFGARTAAIALEARSLDADALLSASTGPGIVMGGTPPADWDTLRIAAGNLLWLYPDFTVRLALEAGQVQLRGEFVEGLKVHGSRTANRWLFDEALATLPGATAVKLAGSLTGAGGAPGLTASVALDGKNLGRLARWLSPSGAGGKTVPSGAFTLQGSLTLSDRLAALEGMTGSLGGTPFTASLHLDKEPVRRLQLSLASDNLDVSFLEGSPENTGPLSPESLRSAWQAGLARAAAMLGGQEEGFETADIDISAGGIKTSAGEAKNVAVHVKASPELIAVSKLNAETADGLVLRGEGAVPLRASGQGRFNARLEARSPQAVLQLAGIAGYGRGSFERRAAGLAPAALSISYGAETSAGIAQAQLAGNLGPARVEGRAQLKGSLSDWRTDPVSAQVKISAPDGNKLLAILFPDAVFAAGPSPSPGTLSIGLNGIPEQLETSAILDTHALQFRFDGAAGVNAPSVTFKGKVAASSQAPEQFLPPAVLALLGGEAKVNLRVSANAAVASDRFEANELKAESSKNVVTGHLALSMPGGATRVDASLKAEQMALPQLFGYFLTGTPSGAAVLTVPATLGAPQPAPDVWSGRPFSIPAFQETEGKVSLTVKAMQLSDAIVLSGAQLDARLGNGRLDVEDLRGTMFGGSLDASFSLAAKESAVAGGGRISLSGADLAALPSEGTPIVTGQASLSLAASGQGLSPRGLISVLRGRGVIKLSSGQLAKLSPAAVQRSAEELLAEPLPLTEETVTKKVLQAVQARNFSFRRLNIPVTVADGILEIRRASFRGEDATVRMQTYLDLNKSLVDSTWQMGVSSDRRAKWPPVKIMLSGPLRELGAKPKTLAADDFVRAVLVRKMEGDISRLEGLGRSPASLNKGQAAAWTATQEPPSKKSRRKREKNKPEDAPAAAEAQGRSFEQRMRDALENGASTPAAR